jgi:tetratricopeptide (TPR) repeat protein
LFADGNRLFRDDLYFAALLRYREAAAAGMDTPLLHYNTGVANYKAQQYDRARESLQKAATYAPLTAISHYNLGLSEYRLGNHAQALNWFRRAANQADRRDIARLARQAILQIEGELQQEAPILEQAVIVQREQPFTHLDLRVRSGFGVDNNVFRSPAEPYVDLSDPAVPIIAPEVQSGVYIPFSLSARYQVNAMENEGFFGSYRFGGRFYQDKALDNADEYLQEIAFGSEFHKQEEDRETRVYSAFKIAQHEENYYDPDTGNSRDVGGIDISDRMSYLRYGPEFWGRRRLGRYSFGFRAKGQLWNYEDVVAVPEYDHEYWLIGLNSHIRLTPTSLLRINADYYTRRYGDRPSYELNGSQPLGNTPVRYDYLTFNLEARQRITQSMWFSVGYTRTDREDRHVGYNDYVRDEYSVRFNMRIGNRFTFEATGRYFNYNYDNAFAFHEPTAGRKTMERTMGSIIASYRMTQSLDLVGEYYYRDVASNDARLAYNRSQTMLAVRWSP